MDDHSYRSRPFWAEGFAETVVDYNGYSRRLNGMGLAWCAVVLFATLIEQARQLAWQKEFAAAEKLYRKALQDSPGARDAKYGLAQVLLWEGKYREARQLFQSLHGADAAEGAATAAYWQGDYRTAAREFAALPHSEIARKSLDDIEAASAGDARVGVEAVDDDQPYRAWRTTLGASLFSDPLTRWDFAAGGYRVNNIDRGIARTEPFFSVTNALTLPWQKLTVTTNVGGIRYPDSTTGPTGGIALDYKISPNSTASIGAQHHEILSNASSVDMHPSVTITSISWSRYAARSWLAGVDAGHNHYFDGNDGGFVQGYALWPVLERERTTIWTGASAAIRDTDETTFDLDAVSGTRTDGFFTYSYRGSYRGYWTPIDFREARAIVTIAEQIERSELKLQGEWGVGKDTARGFGPPEGLSPLPANIYTFDFNRTFHPWRIAAALSMPIASAYRLQLDVERNVTVFYAANAVRASLVRHR